MRSGIRGKRRQRRSFYNRVRWNAFCHLLPWPEWPFTHLPAIRFWPHISQASWLSMGNVCEIDTQSTVLTAPGLRFPERSLSKRLLKKKKICGNSDKGHTLQISFILSLPFLCQTSQMSTAPPRFDWGSAVFLDLGHPTQTSAMM